MREHFDITHECPHCGHELAVDAVGADELIKVTCRVCRRPSTFEAALYRQWRDQGIQTLQVAARASRFLHT